MREDPHPLLPPEVVLRPRTPHLRAHDHCSGPVSQQLRHQPLGDLHLGVAVEQVDEVAHVDDVDLVAKLVEDSGVVVQDVRRDEPHVAQFFPVEEELVAQVDEVGGQVAAVDVGVGDALVGLSSPRC